VSASGLMKHSKIKLSLADDEQVRNIKGPFFCVAMKIVE